MSAISRRDVLKVAAATPAVLAFPQFAWAAPKDADVKAVVDKALAFFKTAQKDDGNFSANSAGRRAGAHGAHHVRARP